MNANPVDDGSPSKQSRRRLALACVAMVGVIFVINDLIGWINGGGIFSIMSALAAVHRNSRSVDVDGAGLRLVFVVGCAAVAATTGILADVDYDRKWPQAIIILSVIGGGFVSDAIFDGTTMNHFMKLYGYDHCSAGDYTRGRGKGRVWFSHYVRRDLECSRLQN